MNERIVLIGLGGIGSQLLPSLVRYLSFRPAPRPLLVLVDGDAYEPQHRSRPLFPDDALGTNKAEALAQLVRGRGLAVQAAALASRPVTVGGSAVDDPKAVSGGYEVLLEPGPLRDAGGSLLPAPGNLLVRARGQASIRYGDRLEVTGRLRPPGARPGLGRRGRRSGGAGTR